MRNWFTETEIVTEWAEGGIIRHRVPRWRVILSDWAPVIGFLLAFLFAVGLIKIGGVR